MSFRYACCRYLPDNRQLKYFSLFFQREMFRLLVDKVPGFTSGSMRNEAACLYSQEEKIDSKSFP